MVNLSMYNNIGLPANPLTPINNNSPSLLQSLLTDAIDSYKD
ncbi:MAG: hypothetical protein K0S74_88 [Chlamydiales bacterium]|jgi:hypothetical protein|nr:hypothetical protein [Chlamydiales bacterium]